MISSSSFMRVLNMTLIYNYKSRLWNWYVLRCKVEDSFCDYTAKPLNHLEGRTPKGRWESTVRVQWVNSQLAVFASHSSVHVHVLAVPILIQLFANSHRKEADDSARSRVPVTALHGVPDFWFWSFAKWTSSWSLGLSPLLLQLSKLYTGL